MSGGSRERRIFLASGNAHKAREWQQLLPGWTVETLEMTGAPPETGATFAENAAGKARYGAQITPTGHWVFGEDSGLSVAALAGAPGVLSARFAGANASDSENTDRLLVELHEASDREAAFHCAVVCVSPAGDEFEVNGTVSGSVAREAAGEAGFGYDPVFVPEGATKTVAELGAPWKRRSSHRARAARRVLGLLDRQSSGADASGAVQRCPSDGGTPRTRGSVLHVDAKTLLTDLLEVSGQVEAAAIVTREGAAVASTLPDASGEGLSRAVHSLASSADGVVKPTEENLVQLQVTLEHECVFVVQDDQHAIGCVTVPHPTAGLVFYDLKSTLRRLAGDQDELVPRPMQWDGSEQAAAKEDS